MMNIRTGQLFSLPCMLRAAVLVLGFLYTVFFTLAYSTAHVMPLTDAVLRRVFLPQMLAAGAVLDALPGSHFGIMAIPGLVPVFMVSLVEARLFLGLANVTGKLPLIGWMGRRNERRAKGESHKGR